MHIHSNFVNAMKNTPFGPTFMTFYNQKFETYKGLKSNVSVLKIVDQYNRNSSCFYTGGKNNPINERGCGTYFQSTYLKSVFHYE